MRPGARASGKTGSGRCRIAGLAIQAVAAVAAVAVGCRPPEPPRADALARYEEAQARLAAKDLAAAGEGFAAAVALGGLRPDLQAEAILQQAYCQACLGDLEAAGRLLDSLEEGAPDLAAVHAMRVFVLRKAGDTAKAESAWTAARRLNPGVGMPRDP